MLAERLVRTRRRLSCVGKFVREVSWKGTQMWLAFTILMVLWFILKVLLHKGGYVHMFLVAAIAILVVRLIAQRKAQYHKTTGD